MAKTAKDAPVGRAEYDKFKREIQGATVAEPAPAILTADGLKAYRQELEDKQAGIIAGLKGCEGQVKAAQERAQQLVGELNQVAGMIMAVKRMQGEAANG